MSAPRRPTIRLTGLAALAALTAALLAGCTSGGGGSAGSGGTASGFSAPKGIAGESAGGSASADRSGGGKGAASAVDRAVVRTGSLDLTAKDPVHVATRITAIVTGAGGRVDAAKEDPTGDASAFLTVRIPADAFDRTLTRIKQEGTVQNVTLGGTDVTSQRADYTVRIAGLETSITRLQQLLKQTTSASALVEIESRLTSRETQREQLLAQQKSLADQVTYATLTITVHEPSLARSAPPSTFLSGLAAGWESLTAVGAGLVVALGVALPWLVALAVLAGIALPIVRAVRRRSRPAEPAAPSA